jgi:hypothetical protein
VPYKYSAQSLPYGTLILIFITGFFFYCHEYCHVWQYLFLRKMQCVRAIEEIGNKKDIAGMIDANMKCLHAGLSW